MAKNKRITDLEAKIKRIKDPELQKQLQDELNDLKGSEGFEDDGDDDTTAKLKEEIASLKSQLEEKQKTAQEKAEDDYAEELLERYSNYKRQ